LVSRLLRDKAAATCRATTQARTRKCIVLPYTTLFRSETLLEARQRFGNIVALRRSNGRPALFVNDPAEIRRILVRQHTRYRKGPDRKSTRLNSSHVKISYAVFCLKKTKARLRKGI